MFVLEHSACAPVGAAAEFLPDNENAAEINMRRDIPAREGRVMPEANDRISRQLTKAMGFAKLVGVKVRSTETAKRVVDQAVRVSGGSTYFAGSELGRLYRDVLAGIFHPSDDESAHSTVANAWLGPLDA